jgi:hypothetical protein
LKRSVQLCCVLTVCILAAVAQTHKSSPYMPEQPLPFSHRMHAGKLALKCTTCHTNRDPGEKMGFASPASCMQCHSDIATDKPAIQKLAAFARDKREIKWVRIYEIPSYVRFSHRAHLTAGNTCVECHGQIKEREQVYRETDMSMAGCMNCHQTKRASIDCTYCHEKMD